MENQKDKNTETAPTLEKGWQPTTQNKPGEPVVKKVAPPSDNDAIEPELENSSNKGQGPAGENL